MKEDDLLTEFPPRLDHSPGTPRNIEEPFFACSVGEQLWHKYRAVHVEAPERPPVCPEDDPDVEGASTPYWDHVANCGRCNED